MIVGIREVLQEARSNGHAVGAFNVSTLEQMKAILSAAEKERASVILETSQSEAEYLDHKIFVNSAVILAGNLPIKVALHLDHGKSYQEIEKAIAAGYTGVHFDGSTLDIDANIMTTKKVVALAHAAGTSVEGEFTYVAGSSQVHQGDYEAPMLTDPEEAFKFIKETDIDIFAGGYGNIHGMYQKEPELDVERIRKIAAGTDAFLSLHGGSGIGQEQIKAAIKAGISKVNVNTELRMAYRRGLTAALDQNPDEIVPYKLMPVVIDETEKVVIEKIKLFSLK